MQLQVEAKRVNQTGFLYRRYESVNAAAHLPHVKVNDFNMRQKQPKKPTLLLFTAISKSV